MPQVYTTTDLIQILDTEGEACLRGQRLSLKTAAPTGHAAIDYFLNSDGIQKYTAYQDFKAAIHDYQRQHHISGLVWRQMTVGGHRLDYPDVDPRLITLPADVLLLQLHRPRILEFWWQVIHSQGTSMDLYWAIDRGTRYRAIEPQDVEALVQRSQWAHVQAWERGEFLELVLQLAWGPPEQAAHWRNWPEAGSEYVHAVRPGHQPIGL